MLRGYVHEIVSIVNKKNRVKKEKICGTCSHYDTEESECDIRDIALPTPPRNVSAMFGCLSWTDT